MEHHLDNAAFMFNGHSSLITTSSDVHYGHVVERIVRRNRMGISEIARKLHISRRTLYNWFETNNLHIDTILKLGSVLGHDFSLEFPNDFAKISDCAHENVFMEEHKVDTPSSEAVYYWMDKYIKLLEKFNDTLAVASKKELV
ncbi:MAG TPA: helix-turn-helix transcriptional regulator [Mucilaginibacter sp.]|jgi:DNA-binding phage protein|nr:helix-turn-helix transcriptional regulator [Mucilaginibacter sp.]